MNVPDFLIWRCAECGAPAECTKKPCTCATYVGIRRGTNGAREKIWWDDPPEFQRYSEDDLREALKTAFVAGCYSVLTCTKLDVSQGDLAKTGYDYATSVLAAERANKR